MREFIKLIENLNRGEVETTRLAEKADIKINGGGGERRREIAPVAGVKVNGGEPDRRRENPPENGPKAQVKVNGGEPDRRREAPPMADVDITGLKHNGFKAGLSDQPVTESRAPRFIAHPEFELLTDILKEHGENGPTYGSVDYFIAEAYVRGLSSETGADKNAIMQEAILSAFKKPQIRAQKRAEIRKANDERYAKQDAEKAEAAKKAEAEKPELMVAETRQDDINHILSQVNHVNNPWGIEFTVSESIEDLAPITPSDDEDEETIEETVLAESVSVWDDGQGRWYYSLSRDGHIYYTSEGSMDEAEVRRQAAQAAGEEKGRDPFNGSPYEYDLSNYRAPVAENQEEPGFEVWSNGDVCVHDVGHEFVVFKAEVKQGAFPDKDAAIAWANYLISGESDATRLASDNAKAPNVQDEAVLAEARKFAILAGIGAKPKKIEASGELADLMALAGVRR